MSSRPGPDGCRVEWARADVESFGHEPMSSCPSPGRCLLIQAPTDFGSSGPRLSRLGLSGPEPMSSRSGPIQFQVVRARTYVESSELGPMFSHPGPDRCRVVCARVDVDSFGPEPMSIRPSPGRCLVVRALADVEPSRSGRCRVELVRIQVE